MQKSYSLQELAAKVGGTLRGNADVVVNNIAALSKAEPNQLTFISNAKFRPLLAESKAGILVVSEADVEFCSPESNLLIVKESLCCLRCISSIYGYHAESCSKYPPKCGYF